MKPLVPTVLVVLLFLACNTNRDLPKPITQPADWKTQVIPPSPQGQGDAEAGLHYLLYGDYLGSGVPFDFVRKKFDEKEPHLQREGDNAYAPYVMNVFTAASGAKVMAGNCFTCHAAFLDGRLVLGLGNSFADFQEKNAFKTRVLNTVVKTKYRKGSPERLAFEDWSRYVRAVAPTIVTENPGANPAFRIAEACVQHRDPQTLRYEKKDRFRMVGYTPATDVPPLWHVGKKHALYYTGNGRGDFAKLLMQASVLGIPDSAYARKVHGHFRDVKAWLDQLQAPKYPYDVDAALVSTGQALFEKHCSGCHGTYAAGAETYPNKLVSLHVVKTDPVYAQYIQDQSGFVGWYNQSWFATSEPPSRIETALGYVAPPLDGIWATAPYLHNGSVPTLDALLNSPSRPVKWTRKGSSRDYDREKVGWKYTTGGKTYKKRTFDTTRPGYSNHGHTFGDKLSDAERKAVIEYLKTL